MWIDFERDAFQLALGFQGSNKPAQVVVGHVQPLCGFARTTEPNGPVRAIMEDPMSTRTAFVTGASRGIGCACAVALAKAGHRVVLAARDRTKLEEVAAVIRAAGGEAHVVEIDMSSVDSIKAAIASAAKDFGRIDILVNNAGIT